MSPSFAATVRFAFIASGWIYEVTSPRYALRCFEIPVETRSPPKTVSVLYSVDGVRGGKFKDELARPGSSRDQIQQLARRGNDVVGLPSLRIAVGAITPGSSNGKHAGGAGG